MRLDVVGLANYVTAVRHQVPTGRRGRPPYRLPKGVRWGQVVKTHGGRRRVGVVRRVVWGGLGRSNRVLKRTKSGQSINTSSSTRLDATIRSRLASLARRGRGLAHKVKTRELGRSLVGRVDNLRTEHHSLRLPVSRGQTQGQGRTPALAARWTDHVRSVRELLSFRPPTLVHG